MSDLESTHPLQPRRGRAADRQEVAGLRAVSPRARGHRGGQLLDRDPAAERHRRAAHGPRVQGLDPGLPGPLPPHARAADEVDPGHRPRRDRHPDPGRARAAEQEGTSRERLGRERFEQRVWEWRQQYGGTIIEQLKRLGASCDYAEERFTLDEAYAQAVLKVFVALYEKGYIYRDRYMVNWDPGTGSAISDLEVEQREVTDTLYYIDYPLASGLGGDHGGHGAARDDARRHRDRRAPRGRALPAADRREGDPAARRAQAEDHRRRLRQARVRHRRAEDHPGPRSQRLRDRPPPRPRAAVGDRRGRPDHRRGARALRGADRRRGPERGRRRAARAGPDRPHRALRRTRSRSRSAPASGSSR